MVFHETARAELWSGFVRGERSRHLFNPLLARAVSVAQPRYRRRKLFGVGIYRLTEVNIKSFWITYFVSVMCVLKVLGTSFGIRRES